MPQATRAIALVALLAALAACTDGPIGYRPPADIVASGAPVAVASPRQLTGEVSTLSVHSENLVDLAAGADGSLYLAELDGIRRVAPDGTVSAIAEVKNDGAFHTDPAVIISNPLSIAVGRDGAVYVLTYNRLWRIKDGQQTVRATWTLADYADGGLVINSRGVAFFIVDDKIKRIALDGTISNFAGADDPTPNESGLVGSGYQDGPAAQALFRMPSDLAIDGRDNLYVADSNNGAVRKITPDGVVSTVVGQGRDIPLPPSPAPGQPTPDLTEFHTDRVSVSTVAAEADGTLYIAGYDNVIRRVSPDGQMTTVAGAGTYCREPGPTLAAMDQEPSPAPIEQCGLDGQGTQASFLMPRNFALGATGPLYAIDGTHTFGQMRIRRVR